jgi:hypothetical protein
MEPEPEFRQTQRSLEQATQPRGSLRPRVSAWYRAATPSGWIGPPE